MLKQRVITAIIGLVIVLGLLYFSGTHVWFGLIWLVSLGCGYEFALLLGHGIRSVPTWWILIAISLIEWVPRLTINGAILLVSISLAIPVVTKNRFTTVQLAAALLASCYIGFGFLRVIQIRDFANGANWILLVMVAIWATDTVAYFTGRAFKGPKLWPAISPKKTLSGAIGGLVGGAVGSIVVGKVALGLPISFSLVVLGIVISLVGQFGDLIESAYKRSSGVKDSGSLLPGHGGLLDRLDSLVFAAPVAYYLISTHFLG